MVVLYTASRHHRRIIMPRTRAAHPRPLIAWLCAIAIATSTAPAAHAANPHAGEAKPYAVQADANRLQRLAKRVVDEARIPGLAIAVVQHGKLVSARGFGVVSSTDRQPITADTTFRIASLSKSFAGTLSAMLVRDGVLAWDAHINTYLPAFKLADMKSAENLTVLDILSHRVGLPYNALDRSLEADEPFPLLVAQLDQAPVICAPGDCYAYQNIAFSLIGDVVFAVTGDFFYHQVEKRLFHPLGMHGATYGRDALEASASWARPHVRSRGRWSPVRAKETYYRVPPAAGVNASINDMALWLIAQSGHRPDVLAPSLLATIHAAQVRTPDQLRGSRWRRERLRDAHYGIGWRVLDYAGHPLLYHAGAVQGYRSIMAIVPEHDLGVVILWNSESGAPAGLLPTLLDSALQLPASDWLEFERFRKLR
ncbi:MAG: serine hydrolase [Lysobacterales bacterium CG17_big_fil_post_rev_8_21_14_2_50_64_11]|nr:MAG: serine hydrolase [Xanthomonadales bacterium CG17_big_fil_post_rev_8_21_14_2_50_64_11]